ncbi:General transcription factor 3C polypeptide 1, partial [Trichinella pseudospiralis]
LSSAEVRQVLDIYTEGKVMEDITVAEACVDEIALEGLDGITLNSLWVRLRTRLGLYLRVDDLVKQYLWNCILQNKELSFYTLPKPRETIDMQCLYIDKLPVNIVKNNDKNLYGSCADFDKRADITRTIRRTKRYQTYDNVIAKYGNSLVVVASQDLRTVAITGQWYSSELFTKELSFALYYPVVERIARSRYFGCVTLGSDSLHKVFKVRSKDVFYTLKRLVALKLVKKWSCELELEDGSNRVCACVCLKRFVAFSKYFPLNRMISYLKSCPQRRATRSQIIEAISVEPFLFDIAKFRMINILSLQVHVKVPVVHVGKRARNHQSTEENEMREACYRLNSGVEGCGVDLVEEIDDKLFELCCEDQDKQDEWMMVENVDSIGEDGEQLMEEAIDEISDLHDENDLIDNVIDDEEEEEEEEECSSDESEDEDDDDYITNTSNYQFKYFQTERDAIIRKLHNAGSDGADHFQLCRQIGIQDKLLRSVMPVLCNEGHARSEFENDGRKRKLRYYTIHSQSQTSHYFQTLFEKTNIDFHSVKLRNSPITDRSCKRLLMILNLLEEKKVLTAQTLTKHIRDTEKEEGYNYEIDKRCSSGLFDLLEELKLIKVYQTLLVRGNKKKPMKFYCHLNVQPDDSDLLASIRKERIQFIGIVKENYPKKNRKRRRSEVSPQKVVPETKIDAKKDEKKNWHTPNKRDKPVPPPPVLPQFKHVTKLKRDVFNYGYQAKCIRLQSVHEFVFYLVHDYRGDTTKGKLYQAEPSCSMDMNHALTAEPTVFLDELSWRRFLPPLPKQNDISPYWLRISDLLSVLPLSIAVQIYSPDKNVQGLMDYLNDPIKRHYLVLDLPEEMRGDLFTSGKLRTALSEVMDKLCFLGLLSQGPRKAQDHSCLLDVFYYVHSGGYLLDTSSSSCGYAVVSLPLTRYMEYRHEFRELTDLHLYWVHLRSIVLSTSLGFKALRNKRQEVKALKTNELLNILPRSTLEDKMPLIKKPVEPRIGSAGFIPQLFLHRHSQWVISTINGCGQDVYDHIEALLKSYTPSIVDSVQFFNRTHDLAYIQLKSYKGVVRQRSVKYFSPQSTIRRICFYVSGTRKRNAQKNKFSMGIKKRSVAIRGQRRRIRQMRVDYTKADFSTDEWTLILMIRSLNAFFSPVGKNVGDIETACQLMYHYLPQSQLRQSHQRIRNRIFNIFTKDTTFCSSSQLITNQLDDIEVFRKFKKQYMSFSCKVKKRKAIYKEAFEILQQMFWKPNYSLHGSTFHSNFKNYVAKDVKKRNTGSNIFQSESLKMENVSRCVFANVFLSSLCLPPHSDSMYEQLLNIYRSFPDEAVTDIPSQLRDDDIITVINSKKLRSLNKYKSNPVFAKSISFNLQFSNSFRKLFPSYSISSMLKDSFEMHQQLFTNTEAYHDVMTDSLGHLLAIAGLICQEKIVFDIVKRREQATLTIHDYSPSVGKMPTCISGEHCGDVNDGETTNKKSLKTAKAAQQSLANLLGSDASARSTNRIVLLALRKSPVISLENCDLRSLNTKVQELRLHFDDVYVKWNKSKLSYEQGRWCQYSKRRALENLHKVLPVDEAEFVVANDTAMKLYEKISNLGYSGITLSEAKTLIRECPQNEQALKLLLKQKMIIIAGLNVPRFVSRKCIQPWGVHTFYDSHSTDSEDSFMDTEETSVDSDENDDIRIDLFMMPRLWVMPNGELNWPMLRWCCEVVFLHILRSPGLSEESLMKELMPGFYPCITFEIVLFLIDIGCLTKRFFTVKQKRFTIFDVEIGDSVEVTSLEPTPNGQDILYRVFEKIPLPHCMKQQEPAFNIINFAIMIGIGSSSSTDNSEADLTHQPQLVSAPTAWLRLKSIFLKNEYGFDSYEWKAMKNSTLFTFIIGTMMAGTAEIPLANQRFKEQHSLSLFANKYEAIRAFYFTRFQIGLVSFGSLFIVRRLQSHLLVSFWRSGIRLGLRIGFFTFSYTCTLACLAAYEDRLKGFHFVFSGALAGALYRINMGLRASFAAGVIGGVLGLCSTAMIVYPALFIFNKSLDEAYKQVREQHFRETLQAIKNKNEISGIQKQFNVSKWEARAILKARQQEQLLADPSLNISKN